MKNKKIITIIISLSIIIFFSAGWFYQSYNNPELKLTKKNITLEYGEKLPNDLNRYIDTSPYINDDALDDISYECDEGYDLSLPLDVGNYTITYTYRNSKAKLKVSVADTTAPILYLKNNIKIFENNTVNYNDYVEIVELSEYKVTINDDNVNYNTAGEYIANMDVIDTYGNENKIDIPVLIEAVVLEIQTPSISLEPNGTAKLEVNTNSNHIIKYTSKDTNIATIDQSGNIIAVNSGTTTIIAEVDGKEVSSTITVNTPPPPKVNNHVQSYNNFNNIAPSDDISGTVYRTKTGDCYHRSGCRYLSRSCISISRSNAISRGLRACSVCKP